MKNSEIDETAEIIVNLILRNMKAGADLETAKQQAFNRMNDSYPVVLSAFLNSQGEFK